jgi:hypothetical protein
MQAVPLDQTHVDVKMAIDLAPVMDRDDVWLLKNGGGVRLSQESGPELFVLSILISEDLQRDSSLFVAL